MNEKVKAIVTLIVTAAVNVANVCGYALDADTWVTAALSVASVVCIIYSWWKNQNITPEAQEAQKVLLELKAQRKAKEAEDER